MEKRALRRLPVTEASCKDVEFIRRVSGLVWIMKAKKEQTKDGQYLVVSFFHRDDLLTGKKRPVLRTFFGPKTTFLKIWKIRKIIGGQEPDGIF